MVFDQSVWLALLVAIAGLSLAVASETIISFDEAAHRHNRDGLLALTFA
jgi:hypothetical protein